MATLTKQEFLYAVAGKLNITIGNQAPSAADYEALEKVRIRAFEALNDEGIYFVQNENEIPAGAAEYLAEIVAQRGATDFGMPVNFDKIADAERRLRVIANRGQYVRKRLRVDTALRARWA